MNIDLATARLLRVLLIGGTVILAMSVAAEVLKPLALAILLAFLLSPIVGRLERRGLPRVLAVVSVLLVATGIAAATGYVVGRQVTSLARDAPTYARAIREKMANLQPSDDSTVDRVLDAAQTLGAPTEPEEPAREIPMPVRIVRENNLWERVDAFFGPFESVMALSGVVLLLLVFILLERDAILDKLIQLVGRGQVGVTTKTLSQIGSSLGNYLLALAMVNTGFGAVIGLGCWAIGLPSPALWGVLAALLRFIPYLGTVLSFSLPMMISIAAFPGWTQPALVLALFAGAEVVVNAVEPLIYGKSTGISPAGLLVSALFWAWLWGPLGLLLANVMTVCLAVAGRHIPGLRSLGTLLSHDVAVADELRWYQRVISHDLDGALALLDEALAERSFEEVCDQIIIPTLSRAEYDRARRNVDGRDVAFIWRAIRDWLDDIAERDDVVMTPPAPAPDRLAPAPSDGEGRSLVGVATGGGADALILRMLNMLLQPSGVRITVVSASGSSLRIADKIDSMDPSMILISHLPPVGLTRSRYLAKRLGARFPRAVLTFAYWDHDAEIPQVVDRIKPVAANHVVVSLATARAAILNKGESAAPAATASEPARA
ncbi:AI-2E family transporter [Paludisphaera sp.]|uniref:AI-2E family transporter n=1 Tax=Paludisphaera sp. TaxID=2017432 RepID=UPI00301B7186